MPQKSLHSQAASGRPMLMLISNSADPVDDSDALTSDSARGFCEMKHVPILQQ